MINVWNDGLGKFEELKPGREPTEKQRAAFSEADRFAFRQRQDDERHRIAQEKIAGEKAEQRAQHAAALKEMEARRARGEAKRIAERERAAILIAETDQSRLVGTERAEQLKTWAKLRKAGQTQ